MAATGSGTGEDLWELQLEVGVERGRGLQGSEGWGEVVRLWEEEENGLVEEVGETGEAGEEE